MIPIDRITGSKKEEELMVNSIRGVTDKTKQGLEKFCDENEVLFLCMKFNMRRTSSKDSCRTNRSRSMMEIGE